MARLGKASGNGKGGNAKGHSKGHAEPSNNGKNPHRKIYMPVDSPVKGQKQEPNQSAKPQGESHLEQILGPNLSLKRSPESYQPNCPEPARPYKGPRISIANTASELEQKIMSSGIPQSVAHKLAQAVHRKSSYGHNWADMGEYTERLMNYKSLGLNDIVREILQTAIALVAPQTRRNAMKDVKNGANTIFIPGYLNAPRSIESFEKEYGEKVAYLAHKDIGELRKLVLEAAKHGKYVKVIGFSDGGKVIEDYINTYGDIEVDAFIAVASNPVKTSSRKVVHVVGDRDILAPLESEYDYHHMDHLKVYGTHTDFIFNPTTQSQLGTVVRNADFRRYNAVKGTYIAGVQAKKAA